MRKAMLLLTVGLALALAAYAQAAPRRPTFAQARHAIVRSWFRGARISFQGCWVYKGAADRCRYRVRVTACSQISGQPQICTPSAVVEVDQVSPGPKVRSVRAYVPVVVG